MNVVQRQTNLPTNPAEERWQRPEDNTHLIVVCFVGGVTFTTPVILDGEEPCATANASRERSRYELLALLLSTTLCSCCCTRYHPRPALLLSISSLHDILSMPSDSSGDYNNYAAGVVRRANVGPIQNLAQWGRTVGPVTNVDRGISSTYHHTIIILDEIAL